MTYEKNRNFYTTNGHDRNFVNSKYATRLGTISCKCSLCRSRVNSSYKKKTSKVDNKLEVTAKKIAEEAIKLMIKKHNDYGSKNISEAPGGAINGLTVRLHDKVERLANLTHKNKTPDNESIRDTFIDILNYSIISLMVLDGTWESNK